MLSVYNSVLAQLALAQGAITGNSAHAGLTVDCGLFGNDFRSLEFVINAQTITDGTHTFSAQESAFAYLVTLGTQSSGTFTLTWNNFTTAAIPYNASAATVLAALVALGGLAVGPNGWAVTGSAGGPYTVTTPGPGSAPLTGSGASLTTPANFGITSGALGAFTAVDPTRIQGTPPVLAAANSNGLFAFGVFHTQRYVQLVDTVTGSTTGGVFSAVALGGAGDRGPVARS
jgi:hypothetical protein